MTVTDKQVVNKWLSLEKRAKEKGLEFNLSLTSVRNLLKAKKCKYTGVKFGQGDYRVSVDRIDSSKGYVKGNVVACTIRINSFKTNLTNEEIQKMANYLSKHKDSTNG